MKMLKWSLLVLVLVAFMGLVSVQTSQASDMNDSEETVITDDEAALPESGLYLEEDNAEESYYSDEENPNEEGEALDESGNALDEETESDEMAE